MTNLNTNVFSVIDFYNSMAESYDKHYKDPVSKREDHFMRSYLKPYVERPHHILDIGSGTGWLLDNFPEIVPADYLGFEPSENMVRIAVQKHPVFSFFRLGAEEIPIEHFEWADTLCLIYEVGNHIDLSRFLTKVFMIKKEFQVIIMFVNPSYRSRAGLDLPKYSLPFIMSNVESRMDRISDLQVTGLTDPESKRPVARIETAYSWIVRFKTCHG